MLLSDIKERKKILREHYRRIRRDCPSELKQKLDGNITEKFLSLEEYKTCETLLCFVSSKIECDTSAIISSAFSDGKKVAVPKCRDKYGNMDFYLIPSVDVLKKGHYGIMEPDTDECERLNDFECSLCVLPGLSFDFEGYRLGFGGGYYDRFMSSYSGVSVGICYMRCMEKSLPKGIFDIPADIIITDKFINRINK